MNLSRRAVTLLSAYARMGALVIYVDRPLNKGHQSLVKVGECEA